MALYAFLFLLDRSILAVPSSNFLILYFGERSQKFSVSWKIVLYEFLHVNLLNCSQGAILQFQLDSFQVLLWKPHPIRIVKAQLRSRLLCKRTNARNKPRNYSNIDGASKHYFLLQSISRLHKNLSSKCGFFSISYGCFKLRRYSGTLQKVIDCSEKIRRHVSVLSVHLLVGVMLVMSLSVSVSRSPSCEFNLL